MGNILNIKKFDPNKIKAGEDICVIIGKRNTGKSYLLRDLLSYNYKDFGLVSVFSKTNAFNHFYNAFIPKFLINQGWDEKKMEKLYKRQENVSNLNCPLQEKNLALIYDDLAAENHLWKNHHITKQIFLNGRHLKFSFYLLIQFVNSIPPYAKNNIDYIFILQQLNNQEIDRLYKEFGGAFPDKKTFKICLDRLTENYGCLVIDNKSKSNKLSDKIFGYRANVSVPHFRFCSSLWSVQRQIEFYDSLKPSQDYINVELTKGKKITLKILKPEKLEPKRRYFFIGKTGTGKSFLLKEIFSFIYKQFKQGIVCSQTEEVNKFYQKFIPINWIYSKHNSVLLKNIFELQKKHINNDKKYNFFIVYDDMISDSKVWAKDPIVQNIFTLGRHYNIGFFLLSQYTNAIPPYAKNNIDYVFILQQQNYEEKYRLFKEYGSIFECKKDFYCALDQMTTKNGCMVINNTVKSNKIEDRVFYYKANKNSPNFNF